MNIVLVPGLFGFDRWGPLEYFNGVASHLEETFPGIHVKAATTNPLGSVANRADILAQQIGLLFGSEEVHLVAHSMGGLDARFLVSHNLIVAAQVKTIVTVATPHSGSPVATLLDRGNPLNALPGVGGAFVDELRSNLNAINDLSEQGAALLNQQCPDVPHIRYLEIAGTGRDGPIPTSLLLAGTYLFVRAKAGINDGVVPLSSAQRDRPLFASWAGDHNDLIGHDLNGPTALSAPKFDYLAGYADIIRRGINDIQAAL
jgi:triacylglycerol lipase